MRTWAVLGVALFLAGCSGPFRVVEETPRSIAICIDPTFTPAQQAADRAQQHCRAQGLNAEIRGRDRCGLGGANTLQMYACVP